MNNLFEENKRSFLLLLGLLFLLLVVVFFLFIRPLENERESAESQVVQLNNEVESLQEQVDEIDTDETVGDIDLERKRFEKKIPFQPELSNFLQTLNEIELVSGSKIVDYSFIYDGTIPERPIEEETEEQGDEQEEVEESLEDDDTEVDELEVDLETGEAEQSPSIELLGIPENIHLVTVSMELYSPDYNHFQEFLQEIEKQERIMMISYLEFEQPGEFELLEIEDESILAYIDVTTFYYEE